MSAAAGAGTRPQAQQAESSGCLIQLIAAGLIVFGLWFGYNKSVEFLYNRTYDPNVAIEAEMEYLRRRMDCLPGEVLEITPLGNHGARSVRCVPGGNMPRREPRG